MKKITLIFLLMSQSAFGQNLISEDWCNIHWESLNVVSGGSKRSLSWHEANDVLQLSKKKEIDCLSDVRVKVMDKRILKKVEKDNCPYLPRKFYADKNGNKIYEYSVLKWKQVEKKIVDGYEDTRCLEKYLD